MPLINDIYGNESLGRKKHGGPLVPYDPAVRLDGQTNANGGFQAWGADGAPFVRSVFRAAPDDLEEPPDFLKGGRRPIRGIEDHIEGYKQALIEQGREHEILPSGQGSAYASDDGLPEEATEALRIAFASKDQAAMAQAMIECDKYDPKHKHFDDRIKFWVKEFKKAWSPELKADDKVSQEFILKTIEPFAPPEFKELEKDRLAFAKYEEKKALAKEAKLEKQKEVGLAFPPAMDLTDSALSVIQAKSSSMEWEKVALMGAHPGVMFGAHCAATLDSFEFEGLYGEAEYAPDEALDFARRYPMTKGRRALPEGAEDVMSMRERLRAGRPR